MMLPNMLIMNSLASLTCSNTVAKGGLGPGSAQALRFYPTSKLLRAKRIAAGDIT
jgi:hypothetical protein